MAKTKKKISVPIDDLEFLIEIANHYYEQNVDMDDTPEHIKHIKTISDLLDRVMKL